MYRVRCTRRMSHWNCEEVVRNPSYKRGKLGPVWKQRWLSYVPFTVTKGSDPVFSVVLKMEPEPSECDPFGRRYVTLESALYHLSLPSRLVVGRSVTVRTFTQYILHPGRWGEFGSLLTSGPVVSWRWHVPDFVLDSLSLTFIII